MYKALIKEISRVIERDSIAAMIRGRRVLEVGAYNVNGTAHTAIDLLGPSGYTGVDMRPGPNVDEVCNIYDLRDRYGVEAFDVVVCTETLEHVEDWRRGIRSLSAVLKVGGLLIFSAPAPGFKYHEFPHDYWRFDMAALMLIFQDYRFIHMTHLDLPGVLLFAQRLRVPAPYLEDIELERPIMPKET